MGQTLVKNYIHLVFRTKYSQPYIIPPLEDELYAYIGGICHKLDCQVLEVGGYIDHIHILCNLSKNVSLSTLLKNIKMDSSKWVKTKNPSLPKTFWQNGYGAFAVSTSAVDIVRRYIKNQHAHHSRQNYRSEYRHLLKKNEMDFDERYVWD